MEIPHLHFFMECSKLNEEAFGSLPEGLLREILLTEYEQF